MVPVDPSDANSIDELMKHAAKLRSDLEGTTVFVASYPEYAAEADLLGVPPSNRVFADAPVLVHLLRRRGVALGSLATHNDTATPAAHNLNSNTNALNEAGVARGILQGAPLDLALAAFRFLLYTSPSPRD